MKKIISLTVAVVALSSLSAVASASEQAKVRSRTADLRAEPSRDGKAKVKLGAGREVSVVAKSGDGEWVRVKTEITHADETIRFEGWLAAADLGLSGSSSNAPVDNTASAKEKSADDLSWVSDDTSASSTPAASGKDPWANSADNAALPAVSSDDSWDSTPASAPAKTEEKTESKDEWSSSSSDSSTSSDSDAAAGW
jgi:hypothetical protein